MVLTRSQARAFYDRFGSKQDAQALYEDAALDELVAHAAFEQATSVFELGCGTGRLAQRLLKDCLPSSASYLGIDISATMIGIAAPRLAPYGKRASVVLSDGAMRFPLTDHATDRVVSTYVLDLLPEADIRDALAEAHRVLAPRGKLCLVSLTVGEKGASRAVSALWSALCRWYAPLVGGCRPLRLAAFLSPAQWDVEYRHLVTRWGVPSEVLIAVPRGEGERSLDGA